MTMTEIIQALEEVDSALGAIRRKWLDERNIKIRTHPDYYALLLASNLSVGATIDCLKRSQEIINRT